MFPGSRFDAGNAYTSTVTGYNDAYQPLGTSIAFPATEGVLSTQGPWVNSTTYNVDGSVNTQVLPSGGGLPAETITTGYDANGYLTSSTGLAAYLASLSYHPFGQPYQAVSGAAGKQIRATTAIDLATGRLTSSRLDTENQTTPGTWDERRTDEYGYDDAGNVKAVTEKLASAVVSAQCFGYDRLRRLTDAWTNTTGTCAAPITPTADGEEAPGMLCYGLGSPDGGAPAVFPQVGALPNLEPVREYSLHGDAWRVQMWEVGLDDTDVPPPIAPLADATMDAFLLAGCVVAWVGLEGYFCDPPALFLPECMSGGVLAAATSSGLRWNAFEATEPWMPVSDDVLHQLRKEGLRFIAPSDSKL